MDREELLIQIETLQNLLVAHATGSSEDEGEYLRLRQVLLKNPETEIVLPRFIKTSRNLTQFWAFIKAKFPTYAERSQYLWDTFRPLLEQIERGPQPPSDATVSTVITDFSEGQISEIWSKALDRRRADSEGAITMARTLLESVCKHILDDLGSEYGEKDDLPSLYRKTSQSLNLAPSQHTEPVFKQILGGCSGVVEGLGALRNKLSDAHGRGKQGAKPAPRHAELAVNLAGAMATYLISTWQARQEAQT